MRAMATERLHPGRRIELHLPLSAHDAVAIAVLDSATGPSREVSCAAMVVPVGEEGNWIYASEGGQWQLLATAGVSRMIIVVRTSSDNRWEDEALKTRLRSVVVALAPRVCFRSGPPVVPFVEYTDNVIHRVIVEELFSSLTGWMVVEDVALDDSEVMCEHRVDRVRRLDQVAFRRRLRFKRMPNLIQTEVALVVPAAEEGSVAAAMRGAQIDHEWLVHKYLPPIVAGLVLAAKCIEPCMERGEDVRVLALGVGGGALPMFLQKQLGFHVQAVDLDEAVLDAAHRHFGLEIGVDMKVIVGDALQFVTNLAMDIRGEDVVGLNSSTVDIHRFHAIVVDVDEVDPRCGLSSPPSQFLEREFLTAARAVLLEGGLLALNVVSNGATSHRGVVSSLASVFDDVYEIVVEGDVNRVMFALAAKGADVGLTGPLAGLLTQFLDIRLIREIRRVLC